MSIKLSVTGIKKVTSFLEGKNMKCALAAHKGLQKAGFFIEAEVKKSIAGQRAEPRSVDTGRFLQSPTTKFVKDTAVVSSDVEYAKYLEYGTTKMAARHHFTNTRERNKKMVVKIIENEINKV